MKKIKAKQSPIDQANYGTYGDLIFYKWRGKSCVRTKGNTGRQAPVAKEQAALLGQASGLSARIRKACKPLLPGVTSRPLMYRLNNTLQQWLRIGQQNSTEQVNDIPLLRGFSFSANGTGDDFYVTMPVSRTADGNLMLHIPAFDSPNPIHPLPFNGTINLHIMAVSCKLKDADDSRVFEQTLNISYTGIPIPANDLLVSLQTQPGCLTIVALSVNGSSKGIVGAMWN